MFEIRSLFLIGVLLVSCAISNAADTRKKPKPTQAPAVEEQEAPQPVDPLTECVRQYRANESSAQKHYALEHGISEAGWDATQDTKARWECKRKLGIS